MPCVPHNLLTHAQTQTSSTSHRMPQRAAILIGTAGIIDAAEAIFARQGYYAATIRDITQAAGVPLSLARYYFGSKDELFMQVLGRRADETCAQLDASLS